MPNPSPEHFQAWPSLVGLALAIFYKAVKRR